MELGVVDPCEAVNLLLELLVIEMASSGRFLSPFARYDRILGVLQLFHLNRLGRENV